MIFNTTGGGTALNFRVVGGSTAPANPTDNCIWINTDTSISSWVFSATQPSPAEYGMIWISMGTSSNVGFNALKKNGIQIYPISAKQYVSGVWVDVTAKSYQGGAWVDWWSGDIFVNGALNHITGFAPTNGTVENSGGILTMKTNGNIFSSFCSNEKIDITGVAKIVVTVESGSQTYAASGNAGIGISDVTIVPQHSNYLAMAKFTDTKVSGEFVVDGIAGINRPVYLGVTIGGSGGLENGNSGMLKISKIEMRR